MVNIFGEVPEICRFSYVRSKIADFDWADLLDKILTDSERKCERSECRMNVCGHALYG